LFGIGFSTVATGAKTKLAVDAGAAGIGLFLSFSHSHSVVIVGYFCLALSLAALLYLQLTLQPGNDPPPVVRRHRLRLAYAILVAGLILQLSGSAFHSSGMNLAGVWIALTGLVTALCMEVLSKVGSSRPPHQPR
jgi:hypothetical protein